MVLYPEAQRKAQAEIDSVLGGTRLPTFDDEKHLPYVSALAKEVQRWHPVVPLGTHCHHSHSRDFLTTSQQSPTD
jgi:cytochrome P450